MNTIPAAKIKMLNDSMRCFAYGLISFIPALGLPFAIGSLWFAGRARVQEKYFWNAAKPYRVAGVICVTVTTIFWFLLVSLIVYNVVNKSNGYDSRWNGDE